MVERKEVEALLAYVEMKLESDKVELPPSVSDATLAALCRTWLALDRGIHVTLSRNDVDAMALPDSWSGQRVRIVKEPNESSD